MELKKIKKSSKIALAIVLTQLIYSAIFGRENTLVGMTMAMASANLLSRDFTYKMLSKTTTFIILNLSLGIISYITSINIYIGLILNLFTIFTITYIYINDFKVPTSYIFLMCYIFLCFSPIAFEDLPRRILALTVGVLIIMVPQYLLNRKSFYKKSNDILIKTYRNLESEIENLEYNKDKNQMNMHIKEELRKLLIELNYRTNRKYYSTLESKVTFNIVVALERLNLIIFNISKDKNFLEPNFLKDLKKQIEYVIKILEDEDLFEELSKKINEIENKYKNIDNSYIKESIVLLKLLKYNLEKYKKLDYKSLNKINKEDKIPNEFKKIVRVKQNLNFDSALFVYSLKLALVISISIFLVKYLNLVYGKWIVMTIYVLMQLYKEDTKIKAKKRFKGTGIGVLIFLCIFSIVKDAVPKAIIIYIAFFFYFYYEDYYKKVVSMTIISLTSVSLVENINILSVDRFICVAIGIVVVIVFNKYVFPYSIEDSVEDLKRKYIRLMKLIKYEINNNIAQDKIIKLVLLCSEIEDKLMINNSRIINRELEVFIVKSKVLLSDIRYLILEEDYIKNTELGESTHNYLIEKINKEIDYISK